MLLITDSPEQGTQFQTLPNDTCTLFTAASHDEAMEFLQFTRIDIVVAAFDSRLAPVAASFEQAKSFHPYCVTVLVVPPVPAGMVSDEGEPPPCDFTLRRPYRREELIRTIAQAIEKQHMVEEIALLRNHSPSPQPPVAAPQGGSELSLVRIGQILRDFTKAFSTNFDLQSTLDQFLDALSTLLRPSRMSILVRHPHHRLFEIKASRGLVEKVAEQIRLREDDGLARWLMTEARILQRAEVEQGVHVAANLNVFREMQVLKAAISMPLMVSGKLVGILNLGERVTGGPYKDDELDIVFSLASQVAVGIQDIELYHEVQTQKNFTEKILRYMSSGLITIDTQEKIQLCNHQAAKIFGMTWAEVQNKDLRNIPSPLGDMLYETLHDGVSYHKKEVMVTEKRLALEVNTYQILDEKLTVVGAAMVFQDLSSSKQLQEERQRANQLDFLSNVSGRMAYEIKNPLVSIRTFIDLMDEHYEDTDFRQQFSTVVRKDVNTINVLTDKLVGFAGQISYNFEHGYVNNILSAIEHLHGSESLDASVDFVDTYVPIQNHSGESMNIALEYDEDLPEIRFDAEQLHNALMYIIVFLTQVSESQEPIRIVSYREAGLRGDVCISLTGSQAKVEPEEIERLFDPFASEHNLMVDVGPCVSQKIIEAHRGQLDVEYKANRDLVFVMSLPPAE